MRRLQVIRTALFALACLSAPAYVAAQNVQSPESPNGARDCVLGDWPDEPELPCGMSLEIARLIKSPAVGGGKPCPIETKTIHGPRCTSTPTATATPVITIQGTATPTATPTEASTSPGTNTPTATSSATAAATGSATPTVATTSAVTSTPTATPTPSPTPTQVNYCAGKTLDQVRLPNQTHDGKTYVFNPSRMIYDRNTRVWYDDQGGSTFVCAYNSGAEKYPDSNLAADFSYVRSGGGLAGRIAYGRDVTSTLATSLDPRHAAFKRACFICGLVRDKKGCFPPGVLITMGDGVTTKRVEDISAGDMVWNPVRKKPTKVLKVSEGRERNALVQVKAGQLSVTMSREHPVALTSGWKQAQRVKAGDVVRDGNGISHTVDRVSDLPAPAGLTVINFVLERSGDANDGLLLADGMVVGDLLVQRELAGKR